MERAVLGQASRLLAQAALKESIKALRIRMSSRPLRRQLMQALEGSLDGLPSLSCRLGLKARAIDQRQAT